MIISEKNRILLSVLMACVVSLISHAEDCIRRFPVAARLDSRFVTSSLYLECKGVYCGEKYPQALNLLPKGIANAASNIFAVIKTEDVKLADDLIASGAFAKEMKGWAHHYRSLIGKYLDDIKICGLYYYGDYATMFFEVNVDGRRIVAFLEFNCGKDGSIQWVMHDQSGRGIGTVTCLLQQSIQEFGCYDKTNKIELPSYVLRVTRDQQFPVHLRCRVTQISDDLLNSASLNDRLSQYLAHCYRVFQDEPSNKYADLFTLESRNKYTRWISKMDAETYASYRATYLANHRRVRFVIDANPLHLVFFERIKSDAGLKFEYIIEEDNQYRMTNFYYETLLDNLLQDDSLVSLDELKTLQNDHISLVAPEVGTLRGEAASSPKNLSATNQFGHIEKAGVSDAKSDFVLQQKGSNWKVVSVLCVLGFGLAGLVLYFVYGATKSRKSYSR